MSYRSNIVQTSGICGILLPFCFFITIAIPISQAPWFDWTLHAISDLYIIPFFNYGMILCGILAFVFSLGLILTLTTDRTGPYLLTLSSLGLIGIGVFPTAEETVLFEHLFVAVAFFLFLIGSLVVIGATLISVHPKPQIARKMGVFALVVAVVGVCSSALLLLWAGIAIPEVIICFSAFAWCLVYGTKMLSNN